MKQKIQLLLMIMLCVSIARAQKANVSKAFSSAEQQMDVLVKNVDSARNIKPNLVSPRTVENGTFKMVSSRDWTSGFFAAELWYLYEYTKDAHGETCARAWEWRLETK